MIDFLILGIAAAGIELIYQKLMFPGHPLHWWFKILHKNKFIFRNMLGYCHICNSVWLSAIMHICYFGVSIYIFTTIGICCIILSLMLSIKYLIYVPTNYHSN